MTAEVLEALPLEIFPDPANARRVYTGIKTLAASIKERGLLEPLGVRKVRGRLVLRFGERRLRAIYHLIEQGDWPKDKPVTCILSDGDEESSEWDGLVENEQREGVPIWQIGAKYLDLLEKGKTQPQIAAAIGKSQGHVSQAASIARGLHPEIVERLNRGLPEQPPRTVLYRMAQMVNLDTYEPDLERQTKCLDAASLRRENWSAVRKRTNTSLKKVVMKRFSAMKAGTMRVPEHAEPYFETFMNYLSGASKRLTWPKEM